MYEKIETNGHEVNVEIDDASTSSICDFHFSEKDKRKLTVSMIKNWLADVTESINNDISTQLNISDNLRSFIKRQSFDFNYDGFALTKYQSVNDKDIVHYVELRCKSFALPGSVKNIYSLMRSEKINNVITANRRFTCKLLNNAALYLCLADDNIQTTDVESTSILLAIRLYRRINTQPQRSSECCFM